MTQSEPLAGGCYCGALRYEITEPAVMKGQCHCRPCQYISGGGPNYYMAIPENGFRYTSGTPRAFARSDLENPRIRQFCDTCGTHIATLLKGRPLAIVKVGTLDNPAAYPAPRVAIHCREMQDFHVIAEGIPRFDRLPDGV